MKRQRHPHILRLEAAFVDGSDLWMIIPLVKGGSLESLLQRGHQQVGAPVIPSLLAPYNPCTFLETSAETQRLHNSDLLKGSSVRQHDKHHANI